MPGGFLGFCHTCIVAMVMGDRFRCTNCPRRAKRRPAPDPDPLDLPAWPGAKHSARTELRYLRAMGERVGPGHPWWQRAHKRRQ